MTYCLGLSCCLACCCHRLRLCCWAEIGQSTYSSRLARRSHLRQHALILFNNLPFVISKPTFQSTTAQRNRERKRDIETEIRRKYCRRFLFDFARWDQATPPHPRRQRGAGGSRSLCLSSIWDQNPTTTTLAGGRLIRRAAVSSATAAVTCRPREAQYSSCHLHRCRRRNLPLPARADRWRYP